MSRSLRIAVVGAGPAGFFATAELLKQRLELQVDLFERLPTPYGLVRHGVAPDHQKIKSIAEKYQREAEVASGAGRLRMFGHVEIGRDVTVAELRERYDAVLFAFGAQSNRRLGIPGEELANVHPASIFVGWYNGHPDCAEVRFDLSAERAVVVGVGNVAIDVARVLAKPVSAHARTDMSPLALKALEESRIRQILVLGRHGPGQASFTPLELGELAEIPECDLVVPAEDRLLDPVTARAQAEGRLDPRVAKNLEIIEKHALLEPTPGRRSIVLRFYVSPTEILGSGAIEGVRLTRNRPFEKPNEPGKLLFEPAGEAGTVPCQLLFRSVGYKVAPLPGVPFDEKSATVPHQKGQILEREGGAPVPGLFVTGWAKRGPSGVIGTNKPDAVETVQTLMSTLSAGMLPLPAKADEDVGTLLTARGVPYVDFEAWKLLDRLELELGREEGRPRRKFVDIPSMLEAIGRSKMGAATGETLVLPASGG